MNRLFFRPEQSGMTKTEAAADTLSGINPDVQLESYTMNITTIDGFEAFKSSISDKQGKSRVDMVLSCVDNYEARMTINQASITPQHVPTALQAVSPITCSDRSRCCGVSTHTHGSMLSTRIVLCMHKRANASSAIVAAHCIACRLVE